MEEVKVELLRRMMGPKDKEPMDVIRRVSRFLGVDGLEEGLKEGYISPNWPVWKNAEMPKPQMFACFVVPVEDTLDSIFYTIDACRRIYASGGGVGINWSKIRYEGAKVQSCGGVAAGPLGFMKIVDAVTAVISQSGVRRGANMAILDSSHEDIYKFIAAKAMNETEYTNMNLSVRVLEDDNDILPELARAAWYYGEPGVVFEKALNRNRLGQEIVATNPCGEQPLGPWESCALCAVNLAKCVVDGEVDWGLLEKWTVVAATVLDAMIDKSWYPMKEIEQRVKEVRKIGVGVEGWHDMLMRMQIPYESEEAIRLAKMVGKFINTSLETWSMGTEKKCADWVTEKTGLHHGALTSIAPTGTVSMIAGTTPGIEPMFAKKYQVQSPQGNLYYEIQGDDKVASEIGWEWHLRHQAAWQENVDAGVSKTINLPQDIEVSEIEEIFKLAYKLGCKGVTVYRMGSRKKEAIKVQKVQDGRIWTGKTMKVATGMGSMYVGLNRDNSGKYSQMFVNVGKSGSTVQNLTESIGRLGSMILEMGGEPKMVIKQLKGIKGDNVAMDPILKFIYSIPDGVAKALEYMIEDRVDVGGEGELCLKCGSSKIVREEGCVRCLDCGWTQCG